MQDFVGFRGPDGRSPTKSYTRGERVGPGGQPPKLSPHEGPPMKLFISLGYFILYLLRKPKFGSIIQQANLRYTRVGTFPPTATGIRLVFSPECEDGHTRDLCLVSLGLPPHFQTYPRSTCKNLLDSGASAVVLQRNPTRRGRGWAPAVYSP